jgi:hypothetical protein
MYARGIAVGQGCGAPDDEESEAFNILSLRTEYVEKHSQAAKKNY